MRKTETNEQFENVQDQLNGNLNTGDSATSSVSSSLRRRSFLGRVSASTVVAAAASVGLPSLLLSEKAKADSEDNASSRRGTSHRMPGGANRQLQFNDNGEFGGDANLAWDKTNAFLEVEGFVDVGGNSTPGKINGVVESGDYPGTPLGLSVCDIAPVLFTSPPSDHHSIMGLSVGVASEVSAFINHFSIVGEVCTPSSYAGNAHAFYAVYGEIDHNSTGVLDVAIGSSGYVYNNVAGTINGASAISGESVNVGGGLIDSNNGIYIRTGARNGTITYDSTIVIESPYTGGTFTNPHVGLRIEDQTVSGLLSNAYALQIAGGKVDLGPGAVVIGAHTPSSATDTGTAGQIAWDDGFIYICVATNSWKRAAIAAW
jgi:hypothetical protein